MPYEAPTVADLQARYPAFADVADATVQIWLNDAARFVDETWLEDDYQPATMAYAAHSMALLGIGAPTGAGALPAGVTRFKSGAMDVTLSDSAASIAARGGLDATVYGREFKLLRRRNFSGPRLVPEEATTCGYPLLP